MGHVMLYALIKSTSAEEAEATAEEFLLTQGLVENSTFASGPYDWFEVERGKARIVSQEDYDEILSEHEDCTIGWYEDYPVLIDADDEPVSPAIIGNKYVVEVDCHY